MKIEENEKGEIVINGVRFSEMSLMSLTTPEPGRLYSLERNGDTLIVSDVTEDMYDDVLSAYRDAYTLQCRTNNDLSMRLDDTLRMLSEKDRKLSELMQLVKDGDDEKAQEFIVTNEKVQGIARHG